MCRAFRQYAPMDEIQRRIREILERRRALLPQVEQALDAANALATLRNELEAALGSLPSKVETPTFDQARRQAVDALAAYISALRSAVAPVEQRFRRGTVNIGVTGQARMGKSTLLRTVSGLGDEQIPTGSGPP